MCEFKETNIYPVSLSKGINLKKVEERVGGGPVARETIYLYAHHLAHVSIHNHRVFITPRHRKTQQQQNNNKGRLEDDRGGSFTFSAPVPSPLVAIAQAWRLH